MKRQTRQGGAALAGLLSFLAHSDPKAPVTGLGVPGSPDRPPVDSSFELFHVMVVLIEVLFSG